MDNLSGMTAAAASLLSHNRYQLKTAQGYNLFDVESLQGSEGISQLYRYQINATCQLTQLNAEPLLRQAASLQFHPPLAYKMTQLAAPSKIVPGIITDVQRLSASIEESYYQLILEPSCCLLRYTFRGFRCFLNQSVTDVVEQILREHGLKGWQFEWYLQRTYPKRRQINQYQENDWQFIERLLSQVGIFYTFTLQPDTQTEVLQFADSVNQGYHFVAPINYVPPSGLANNQQNSLWGVTLRHQVVPHSVKTKDNHPLHAQYPLLSSTADMSRGDGDSINYGEVYLYQTGHSEVGDKLYPEPETANFWARLAHERLLVQQTQISGKSNEASLAPAQVFTLAASERLPEQLQTPLVLTQLQISASRQHALLIDWQAIPYYANRCYRPAALAKPVIAGTLVARIVSVDPVDRYAHQNQHGEYWVKFDADLDEQPVGYSSMPVRLAKPYAGDTYGLHFPLIQGTEVAIAFQQGDPDRPYIAHVLHNGYNPDLVTDKNNTRNVIRTPANNKLRMEDKRGKEHIKLSSEYGGKSQLNLGHLVNQRDQPRGEGFELRSDSFGAIRAGKGLLISSQEQSKAQDHALAMSEVIGQLENALALAKNLATAAKGQQASANHWQSSQQLVDELSQLRKAGLLQYAPHGIGLLSPAALQLASSSNDINLIAGQHINLTAGQAMTVNTQQKIGLFTQADGIDVLAQQGDIDLTAQHDGISLTANKDITIQSGDGEVVLSAAKALVLRCGQAYIKIADGSIELGGPNQFINKIAHLHKQSANSLDTEKVSFPRGHSAKYIVRNQKNQQVLPFRRYQITTAEGNIYRGISNEQGETVAVYTQQPEQLQITLVDDE